jgi:hypothetical protein
MKICKFLTFFAVLFLTGCGTLEIGIERKLNSTATVNVLPTEAAISTAPLVQPSLQPSPTIAYTPPTEALPQPKATLEAPLPTPEQQPINISIYLIAIDDNGQSGQLVGCGDSVIPVQVETTPTKEVLRASMESLLAMKEQYYGESGLYNALYQSDLQLESISLENGKAGVYLTGTMMLGGVCDNPRVKAQLEATALQFSTVQEVSIFINGKPLDEVLSLQG